MDGLRLRGASCRRRCCPASSLLPQLVDSPFEETSMRKSLKNIGLISTGVLAGVLLSLGITATAQRASDARSPLPIDEIRQFTDVFGAIKSSYVEPVDDKKLITEAI